jgi:arylsulfatase A-like enzyme
MGEWKALRRGLAKTPDAPWELYHLPTDPAEQTDLAAQHPDLIAEARRLGSDSLR